MSKRVAAGLIACWCLVPASMAFAQQTREEQIAREQAEKAKNLHPYVPSKAERWVARAEASLGTEPRGLYPWLGSVFPGGLMAVGPGYRMPFGRAVFDAQGAISLKNYRLARATVTLPDLVDHHVSVAVQAQILDAHKISFYGIGPSSLRSDRSTFQYQPASVGASIVVTPVSLLRVGAGVWYLNVNTGPGAVGIPVDTTFTPAQVPGLGADPSYVLSQGHVAVDWRDSPGYTHRGGFYRAGVSSYADRQGGALSFRRVDVDAQQFVPILRANWVIAVRGSASLTYTNAGAEVPYFLMPSLGGGSDLRGFSTGRFRDRNRLLTTFEYRWTPSHLIDMAIFHDAGKVTGLREHIDFHGVINTNGIGIRLHAPKATVIRFEYAHSHEGNAIIVAFGPIF